MDLPLQHLNLSGRIRERFDLSSGERTRPMGPWKLYDEKYLLDSRNAFNSKDQSTWLEDLKDYLSGRTPELDQLFSWCEAQPIEIKVAGDYNGVRLCLS